MSRIILVASLFIFLILAATRKWWLGVGLFAVFISGLFFLFYGSMEKLDGNRGPKQEISSVRILYGEMHRNLFHDPEFRELLKRKYAMTVTGTQMSVQEMGKARVEGIDGVWPSGMQSVHLFQKGHPGLKCTQHPLFSTPLVICSWPETVSVLMQKGLVEKQGNSFVFSGMASLLTMMAEGKKWADLGQHQAEGSIKIAGLSSVAETDSGIFGTVLVAQALRQGNLSVSDLSGPFLTKLRQTAAQMRTSEKTSGDLFSQYIRQGQGSFPLILAEECHVPAFYQAFPNYRDTVAKQVKILRPEPTVRQYFPFLSLNPAGEKLAQALADPQIHEFILKKCGFRSELKYSAPLPEIFATLGLPEQTANPLSVPPETAEAVMSAFLPQ